MRDPLTVQHAPHTLLVDDAFPRDLHSRIDAATQRVWLQFMTFEGDAAGQAVAERLVQAKARGVDVQVIVDAYTDMMVSDTYHRDPRVEDEVAATKAMFERLRAAGIPVVRTRPLGARNALFLFRDHKKIVVIDDACYLGGINVSDHNYAWHDFMVRFDEPEVTAACAEVFAATRRGAAPDLRFPCGLVTNRHVEATFDSLLREARKEVVLAAPYAADLDLVRRFRRLPRTLHRLVLAASTSNLGLYRLVNGHVHAALAKAGVDVRLDDEFTHARFLLVDREVAFVSSSNFGRESFRCKDEIGIVIRDPAFVGVLYDRLVRDRLPAMRRLDGARPLGRRLVAWATAHLMDLALWLIIPLGRRLSHVLDE